MAAHPAVGWFIPPDMLYIVPCCLCSLLSLAGATVRPRERHRREGKLWECAHVRQGWHGVANMRAGAFRRDVRMGSPGVLQWGSQHVGCHLGSDQTAGEPELVRLMLLVGLHL